MKEKIVLFGSGGHAKSVVDTIERLNIYEIAGFLEVPQKHQFVYKGYRVIGVDDDLKTLMEAGIHHAFVTVGYMGVNGPRETIYHWIKQCGCRLPSIIDPAANIAQDVQIGEGTYIGKGAVVNAAAQIGRMCILNTGSIVEHECVVDDYTHVAVGGVLCGQVSVGKHVLIGANATVIQQLTIGDWAIIGAGSVVLRDVGTNNTVAGNPARVI